MTELESVRMRLADVEKRIAEIGREYESTFKPYYICHQLQAEAARYWYLQGMEMARLSETKQGLIGHERFLKKVAEYAEETKVDIK